MNILHGIPVAVMTKDNNNNSLLNTNIAVKTELHWYDNKIDNII